jgi:hypothetical protein
VAFNFVACDRDQELLLPRFPQEWRLEDWLQLSLTLVHSSL